MAVAFDAVGPSSSGQTTFGTATTFTWTHTPSGVPTAVIVAMTVGAAQAVANGTCTYGGASMTHLGFVYSNQNFGANNAGFIELFGLAAPPSGAQTVLWTAGSSSGSLVSGIGVSLTYTGTGTTGPTAFGNVATNSGATGSGDGAGSVSLTGTGASNSFFAMFGSGTGSQTLTTGSQRYLNNLSSGSGCGNGMGGDITSSAGGTVTMSGTWSTDFWAAMGVELLAAGSVSPVQASTQVMIPPGHRSPMSWHGFHRAMSQAPAVSQFTDSFAANDLAQQWQTSYGTFGWSSGSATIGITTAFASGIGSTLNYDLTNSAFIAKVTPYTGGTGPETWMQAQPGSPSAVTAFLACFGMQYNGGNLQTFWANAAGASTIVTSATYNATNHAWWRIRESAGTIFFDTAPDGSTWTNFGTLADSTVTPYMNLQALFVNFGGGVTSGTSGTSQVTSFNTPPGSSNVTANAGLAAGTGTAQQPNPALTGADQTGAAGTGTAQAPAALVQPAAVLAAGTGTAQGPAALVQAGGLATGTGTAQAPLPALTALAGLATGTGTAFQPATASSVTVTAGLATGTGTAQQPVVLVKPAAGQALGTGTAQGPGWSILAALASGTGTAQPPVGADTVTYPDTAAGTGTAQAPAAMVTAFAGLATGTGTAQQPSWSIRAGLATATGTAFQPAFSLLAGLATGTGTAQQPVSLVQPVALLAAGTGTALAPNVNQNVTITAGLAAGTGTAQQPVALVKPPAGLATGTGTAQAPAALVQPNAGQAAGTGTAQAPVGGDTVTWPDTAAGTGTAQPPVALVKPNAGQALGTGTAQQPAVALTPALATGTGTAQPPVARVTAFAVLATGTGTAFQPNTSQAVIASAGLAAGTGTAQQPVALVQPGAGQALGTGTAQQPGWSIRSGLASGTGTAQAPVPLVKPAAGLGAGTGTAFAPATSQSTTAHAGLATGTGTAQQPSVSLVRPPLHLGAVVSYLNYGGTLSEASSGGSAVTVANLLGGGALNANAYAGQLTYKVLGGTAAVLANLLGGSLNYNSFGGSLTGWTMQQTTLAISEFNDETINIAITNNGSPYNLTGVTVQMLFKTQAGTPDTSALVFSSTGGSPAITITNAAGGLATAVVPNADLDAETYNFFRIDVIVSGLINTCLYGPITWTTL